MLGRKRISVAYVMAAAVIILGSFMQHVCRYFEALPIQATALGFIDFESEMRLLFHSGIGFQMYSNKIHIHGGLHFLHIWQCFNISERK